jgi:hypothetical protein
MERYFGNWSQLEDIAHGFEIDVKELEGIHVIAATYEHEAYEGYANVIFMKDGKYFEAHGSHCSCNGLEGQWDPQETSYEALMDRYTVAEERNKETYGSPFVEAVKFGLINEMFEREVLVK